MLKDAFDTLTQAQGWSIASASVSAYATDRLHNRMHMSHTVHKEGGSAVYGLGFIGAAVYFIGAASGFWAGVVGLLKALVWPAFLVYEVLRMLYQ